MTIRLVIPLVIFIFFLSCGQSDDGNAKAHSNILESPQLRNITDSIKRFPDNPELRLNRALLLSQMNYHERATDDYKKAWELTGDQNVLLEYASNLMLAQQLPQA